MATTIKSDYLNAVVGILRYADDQGVILVECDDPFAHHTVATKVSDWEYALLCVDLGVCVHDGIVHRIPALDEQYQIPWGNDDN